ncbi:MBL fold metallo-hydrolase [Halanaerobacter jeridensis]|uniref:Glyoxylase-like metal-dependent hydrolase (Beta-lactamase superfamily II) n=1 Tax=Halanaerobacter jeridensis TaxID=706427 RepID=A0A939BQG4_9FIRM|nr:MBL fold metallo-hydrolase [Halanaerobacter jeridensis]MBM7556284.1 glyoxylase-like metal-dependent hydrolase (beta-lactamase superfamily II) [Halanaerobacter jeridensis]
MFIERLIVGNMESNAYIVADEDTTEAIVIDPGGSAEKILKALEEKELDLKLIINTHGHIDHIAANEKILAETNAQLLVHEADANFLTNPELNLSSFMAEKLISPAADRVLEAGGEINCGEISLEVIHTPGHTKGSICLLGADVLFSGDTLFARGVGRTDLPTGSRSKLNQSLEKIVELDDEIMVYPGHGPSATLAEVKENNPYL